VSGLGYPGSGSGLTECTDISCWSHLNFPCKKFTHCDVAFLRHSLFHLLLLFSACHLLEEDQIIEEVSRWWWWCWWPWWWRRCEQFSSGVCDCGRSFLSAPSRSQTRRGDVPTNSSSVTVGQHWHRCDWPSSRLSHQGIQCIRTVLAVVRELLALYDVVNDCDFKWWTWFGFVRTFHSRFEYKCFEIQNNVSNSFSVTVRQHQHHCD